MSKSLFDKQPLIVIKELAKIIGLNEAIILQQLHCEIDYNKTNNINFVENRYWVRKSIKTWHEETFCFWSFTTVKRTFSKLENNYCLLTSKNFNNLKFENTKSYSINYDNLSMYMDTRGGLYE